MSEPTRPNFATYEYKELTVRSDKAAFYLDSYESFGWQQDEKFPPQENGGKITLKLKRNRKLINKVELTRLQRNFESSMEEIIALENSKSRTATIWALAVGLIGTAFMAGSVFAIVAKPPRVVWSIILAVPAVSGWVSPYFVYQKVKEQRAKKVAPFIEAKMEEIYAMCEKGHSLL